LSNIVTVKEAAHKFQPFVLRNTHTQLQWKLGTLSQSPTSRLTLLPQLHCTRVIQNSEVC